MPEGNAQLALQVLFSQDPHFLGSTHTLLSSYYSLIVGHVVNTKTETETQTKSSLAWKQSRLTVGDFSYSHSSRLLPVVCHHNGSKYSIRLY